jgi:hypothetical protein
MPLTQVLSLGWPNLLPKKSADVTAEVTSQHAGASLRGVEGVPHVDWVPRQVLVSQERHSGLVVKAGQEVGVEKLSVFVDNGRASGGNFANDDTDIWVILEYCLNTRNEAATAATAGRGGTHVIQTHM